MTQITLSQVSVSANCTKCYIQIIFLCSQVSTVCWLSRLINLNWRFPQAAFPSSNERQVPVKVGAILLSNIKIEAFSSLSGRRGVGGVIAPTSSHHLLCLFTLSLVPFFGVCRVFKSLTMPLMPSLIFRICTGSIWSTDFKAQAPLHLLLVTIWSVSNHIQRLNKQSGEGGVEADFMINKI